MISEFDQDSFRDKYSDWTSTLHQDTRFRLHFTNEQLEDHLSSKRVKNECDYLGITLEKYIDKYIIKAEEE